MQIDFATELPKGEIVSIYFSLSNVGNPMDKILLNWSTRESKLSWCTKEHKKEREQIFSSQTSFDQTLRSTGIRGPIELKFDLNRSDSRTLSFEAALQI